MGSSVPKAAKQGQNGNGNAVARSAIAESLLKEIPKYEKRDSDNNVSYYFDAAKLSPEAQKRLISDQRGVPLPVVAQTLSGLSETQLVQLKTDLESAPLVQTAPPETMAGMLWRMAKAGMWAISAAVNGVCGLILLAADGIGVVGLVASFYSAKFALNDLIQPSGPKYEPDQSKFFHDLSLDLTD